MFRAPLAIFSLLLAALAAWGAPADAGSFGRVTADSVRLRTGPGTAFTSVGRVSNGQKIPILEEKNGWLRTQYPADGPCWVSRHLIRTGTGTAPKTGIVTVDSVLVRAAGETRAETVAILGKGNEVKILGEVKDWLRIVPPPGANAWVLGKFVERPPVEKEPADAGTGEAETAPAVETPGAAARLKDDPREIFIEAEAAYRIEMEKLGKGDPADLLVPGRMFVRVANDYFCDEETRRLARARIAHISAAVPPDAGKTLADYDAQVLKDEIERVKILYEREKRKLPAPLEVDRSLRLR